MKLLEEINNRGTTVLVVTHNREIVNSMKKRVITMRKGVVVSMRRRASTMRLVHWLQHQTGCQKHLEKQDVLAGIHRNHGSLYLSVRYLLCGCHQL